MVYNLKLLIVPINVDYGINKSLSSIDELDISILTLKKKSEHNALLKPMFLVSPSFLSCIRFKIFSSKWGMSHSQINLDLASHAIILEA